VLSKCDCNTLRIAEYRSLSVTTTFHSPTALPSHSCERTCHARQALITIRRQAHSVERAATEETFDLPT
jgi:hypothetical protein